MNNNIINKLFNILYIFILSSSFCIAQISPYEYIGTLQISKDMIVSYKINFTVKENGKIEGYSITDFMGENQTKSIIEGAINLEKNTISFNEIENVNTKSNAAVNDFCYVHIKNAPIKQVNNKSIIKGNFVGLYKNGSTCIDGYLYLVGTNHPLKKNDNLTNKAIASPEIENKKSETHLLANDKLKKNWSSDSIVLKIWDAEIIDYDKITLIINGKEYLSNFEITNTIKIIKLPFENQQYVIEIIAINEGNYPPNTANIDLIDGENKYRIVSSLKEGEKATLILERKM